MFLTPSQKRLLSSLNPLFVVGVAFLVILARSSWRGVFPGTLSGWDILLPVIVFCGQRRSVLEGIILSLFVSHLYSLSSAAPIGVFATYYLIIFGLARSVSYVLYASTAASVFVLLFMLSVLGRFLLTLVASFFGHGWPVWSFSNLSLWGVFVTSIFGFVVYIGLTYLDRVTFKVPPNSIELGENEL